MRVTRRKFIEFSSLAGIGLSLTADSVFGKNIVKAFTGKGFELSAETFIPFIGAEFEFTGENGSFLANLRDLSKNERNYAKDSSENFTITFEVSGLSVKQENYRVSHPVLGEFELFAVPEVLVNKQVVLSATINRL